MVRRTRRRLVLGLLNRHSLLYLREGRGGGGGYRGAHWHTAGEVREPVVGSPARDLAFASAVFVPAGRGLARLLERAVPSRLLIGGFLAVAADVR